MVMASTAVASMTVCQLPIPVVRLQSVQARQNASRRQNSTTTNASKISAPAHTHTHRKTKRWWQQIRLSARTVASFACDEQLNSKGFHMLAAASQLGCIYVTSCPCLFLGGGFHEAWGWQRNDERLLEPGMLTRLPAGSSSSSSSIGDLHRGEGGASPQSQKGGRSWQAVVSTVNASITGMSTQGPNHHTNEKRKKKNAKTNTKTSPSFFLFPDNEPVLCTQYSKGREGVGGGQKKKITRLETI